MDEAVKDDLPDYRHPPIIESVFGVQFKGLEQLTSVNSGLFWRRIRGNYPEVKDSPPMPAIYDIEAPPIRPDVFIGLPQLRRTFFISEARHWVLQLQHNRLHHNWRAVEEGDEYPRYEACFSKFNEAWSQFRSFCEDNSLPDPSVDQLELTYINHMPVGLGWNTLGEVSGVFPDVSWRREGRFLPELSSLSWRATFEYPELKGRLHVQIQHALRKMPSDEKSPVLLCELTVRGLPKVDVDFAGWFAGARGIIVHAFADLTDPSVQEKCWGRQ